MCSKPYRQGVLAYGCGQCTPCRINRRRLWTSRLMLESRCHADGIFVTLTYDEEHLPKGGTLRPADVQLFLKRFRARVYPMKVRFFLVGEYGENTFRPHYHLLLFGARFPLWFDGKRFRCSDVEAAWDFGFIHVGRVSRESVQYCVSYLFKGQADAAYVGLCGRVAEFVRMSLRPGIGAGAMASFEKVMVSREGCGFIVGSGDVVSSYRFDGKHWPLGRYLRGKLREALGWSSKEPLLACRIRAASRQAELSLPGAFDRERAVRVVAAQRGAWLRANRQKGRL